LDTLPRGNPGVATPENEIIRTDRIARRMAEALGPKMAEPAWGCRACHAYRAVQGAC
jgi:hypothetical protein